jgi:hypothetical protein
MLIVMTFSNSSRTLKQTFITYWTVQNSRRLGAKYICRSDIFMFAFLYSRSRTVQQRPDAARSHLEIGARTTCGLRNECWRNHVAYNFGLYPNQRACNDPFWQYEGPEAEARLWEHCKLSGLRDVRHKIKLSILGIRK